MKRYAIVPVALMVFGIAVGGCGTMRGGRTVVKFDEGKTPITTTVSSTGTYALYALTDYNPKVTIHLKEGDVVGFKNSQTGEVMAVAGDREIPVPANASYYWKRQD
jgi:hypothetical protein